jgi:hypothetical protein
MRGGKPMPTADAEHSVWRISLSRGDEGVEVFVDYVDGTVLGELRYILD